MTFIAGLLIGLICAVSLTLCTVSLVHYQNATTLWSRIVNGAAAMFLGLAGLWALGALVAGALG